MVKVYNDDVDQAIRVLRKQTRQKLKDYRDHCHYKSAKQRRNDKDFQAAARRKWTYNR